MSNKKVTKWKGKYYEWPTPEEVEKFSHDMMQPLLYKNRDKTNLPYSNFKGKPDEQRPKH